MRNIKTVPSAAALKAARASWNAVRMKPTSDANTRKAREEYARCAVRAAEESLGEKLLPSGKRLRVISKTLISRTKK